MFSLTQKEFTDTLLSTLFEYLKSPDGMTMIFEEAEKVRMQLGVSPEEFRRGFAA